MISTRSPTWVAFASSWAWQMVRRFRNLPYFGCGTRRSISTRRVLFILSEVTTPISVLRRVRGEASGVAGVGLIGDIRGERVWLGGGRGRDGGLGHCPAAAFSSRSRRIVLIRAISRLAL